MRFVTRRRFMLLSAVALLGAACGAPAAEPGLRGSGTTYRPREAEVASVVAESAASDDATTLSRPVATMTPVPRLIPTPTPSPLAESDPIVPADAIPTLISGSTDQEMHVVRFRRSRRSRTRSPPAAW